MSNHENKKVLQRGFSAFRVPEQLSLQQLPTICCFFLTISHQLFNTLQVRYLQPPRECAGFQSRTEEQLLQLISSSHGSKGSSEKITRQRVLD